MSGQRPLDIGEHAEERRRHLWLVHERLIAGELVPGVVPLEPEFGDSGDQRIAHLRAGEAFPHGESLRTTGRRLDHDLVSVEVHAQAERPPGKRHTFGCQAVHGDLQAGVPPFVVRDRVDARYGSDRECVGVKGGARRLEILRE